MKNLALELFSLGQIYLLYYIESPDKRFRVLSLMFDLPAL